MLISLTPEELSASSSNTYIAEFQLTVSQVVPLSGTSAVIYLGELPAGVTVSSGPTGGVLYVDDEGRAFFTSVPGVHWYKHQHREYTSTNISTTLMPSVFMNPVITIVSGATSVAVLLSGTNVFDLNGADAYRILANDQYLYDADHLSVLLMGAPLL